MTVARDKLVAAGGEFADDIGAAVVVRLRPASARSAAPISQSRKIEDSANRRMATTGGPTQRAIGDFTPRLVELSDDLLFGDIWTRSELSDHPRVTAPVPIVP